MKSFIILSGFILFGLTKGLVFAQKHHHHARHGHHAAPAKVRHSTHAAYHRKHAVIVRPAPHQVIKSLPHGHLIIPFRQVNYYCHQGHFYTTNNGAYQLILPPVGLRIKALPPVHHRIVFRKRVVFYAEGVYYVEKEGEYEVIEPEKGMSVPALPEDLTELVRIDDQEYTVMNDQLYQKNETGDAYVLKGNYSDDQK